MWVALLVLEVVEHSADVVVKELAEGDHGNGL